MERMMLTIKVLNERADEEWSIPEFLSLIREVTDKVPDEYRDAAKVELGGWGEEWGYLTITYQRWETDAELAKRVSEREAYLASEAQREYNQYMALKRKYG